MLSLLLLFAVTISRLICYWQYLSDVIIQGGPKTDTQFYIWDTLGNSAPILTILSLLQEEIYGA